MTGRVTVNTGAFRWLATALTLMVLVGGCTGGAEPEASSSSSARPTASWRPGEFRELPDGLCEAVTEQTLRRLRLASPARELSPGCSWETLEDEPANGALFVHWRRYSPPETRLGHSATDEARYGFQRLPEWEQEEGTQGTPVRGLGDAAKLMRVGDAAGGGRNILLAVRLRNTVLLFSTSLRETYGRDGHTVPPLAQIETGVVGAAREMLSVFGVRRQPPDRPAYGQGEVREVGNVCEQTGAVGGRLVPGEDGHRLRPRDTTLNSGCRVAADGDNKPGLTVYAEAIPPSAATGQTGTAIATELVDRWSGDGPPVPKIGDQAKIDHFSFEKGRSRESTILVRRGNLLVSVEYGKGGHPSKKAMDHEVIVLAKSVLVAQR